jgi:acylphosphatase
MKKVRAVVIGRVQGVWFRAAAADKARELGVDGYVRNLSDGSVEFVAAGDDDKVDALVLWAKHGPPLARVHEVKVKPLESNEEFTGFRVMF